MPTSKTPDVWLDILDVQVSPDRLSQNLEK